MRQDRGSLENGWNYLGNSSGNREEEKDYYLQVRIDGISLNTEAIICLQFPVPKLTWLIFKALQK